MKMSFDEVVAEYRKRGVPDDFEDSGSSPKFWADDCAKCDVCGVAMLHDDDLYVDGNTGEHLCDNHSDYDEENDVYVKSP